ncbi:nucleotide-binding protein [Cupriavidus necator]|uniref:nucleotide-binding protein n=1 Tax=Cupriavidus necator TaxID=106590 RepID=UPI00339D49C4
MKPKIFIGSSREGIKIANALHANLTYDAECTVWKDGVFQPSSSTLSDLMRILRSSDFGIFVFSPDDISIMRDSADQVVRDNVLFELGLFIGRLGPERCFFLVPDSDKIRLPTDLYGVNPTKYESNRSDANWEAAVNPACMQIRRVVNELRSFQDTDVTPTSLPISISKTIEKTPSAQSSTDPVNPAPASTPVLLTLEPYKKSFLLKGNTYPHKSRLSGLGYLSYNKALQAWVVPQSKEDELRKAIADLL